MSTPDSGQQAPAQPQAQPQQVQVDDGDAISLYANFCRVTGTPEELLIDFGLNQQPMGVPKDPIKAKQRIIVNFYTAKRLLAALSMSVQRHEQVFGVLETDITHSVKSGFAWEIPNDPWTTEVGGLIIAESGYPDYSVGGWYGVSAPAKVPEEVTQKITASLNRALTDEPFRASLEKVGFPPLRPKSQAEIDKFIGLVTLNQGAYRSSGAELCSWLFDHVSFESNLDEEDRHRYEVANFYAGQYCRQLSHRYLQSQDGAGLTRELRRFYRQGQHGKLDMIRSG